MLRFRNRNGAARQEPAPPFEGHGPEGDRLRLPGWAQRTCGSMFLPGFGSGREDDCSGGVAMGYQGECLGGIGETVAGGDRNL